MGRLPSHGRYKHSSIFSRPDYAWPDGKRLAVYFALGIEHYAFNEGLVEKLVPGIPEPDVLNTSWREYGNRVGGWRLLELFEEFGLPLSVLLNTACYDHCPELIAAVRARGDEIVAHGRTNSENANGMSEAEERALIAEVTAAIKKHEGKPPGGWMSPGAHPSALTEDLLVEAGYRYTLDWPMDDQPVWMKARSGPLLSVPYPHEVNDVPMVVLHHGTSTAFADMAVDQFDEMLAQSHRQPLALGITIHSFIVGQPFRLRQFRRVLEHISRRADSIWFTTAGQIAEHYAAVVPPKE